MVQFDGLTCLGKENVKLSEDGERVIEGEDLPAN
jgi:hypothetical protein